MAKHGQIGSGLTEIIVLNSNPVTIDLTLTESLTTTDITAQFSIEDVDMHE